MTKIDFNTDTRTLEGARYVLTVKNQTNRLYDKGPLGADTEVVCLRRNESGYYFPTVGYIVHSYPQGHSGRITVDLYTDRSERVSVSPKAILWKTEPETCAECGLYAPRHHKKCGSYGMDETDPNKELVEELRKAIFDVELMIQTTQVTDGPRNSKERTEHAERHALVGRLTKIRRALYRSKDVIENLEA